MDCIEYDDVLRTLVIFAFFLKVSVVALLYLHTSRTDMSIALLLKVSSFDNIQ